jgi:hypothetical protein
VSEWQRPEVKPEEMIAEVAARLEKRVEKSRLVTLYLDEYPGVNLAFTCAYSNVSSPPMPGTVRWKIDADLATGAIMLRKV